jgi:hypothetical protein
LSAWSDFQCDQNPKNSIACFVQQTKFSFKIENTSFFVCFAFAAHTEHTQRSHRRLTALPTGIFQYFEKRYGMENFNLVYFEKWYIFGILEENLENPKFYYIFSPKMAILVSKIVGNAAAAVQA